MGSLAFGSSDHFLLEIVFLHLTVQYFSNKSTMLLHPTANSFYLIHFSFPSFMITAVIYGMLSVLRQ